MAKIMVLTPEELDSVLSADWPKNATCWSNATDEVRDMCRGARERAGIPIEEAVDFRSLTTPAEWNTQGINATVRFYAGMSSEKQAEFCKEFGYWLGMAEAEDSVSE